MMRVRQWIVSFVLLFCVIWEVKGYHVEIKSTGSYLIGSTVNFTAVLYDDGAVANTGTYRFSWSDNAQPVHKATFETQKPYSNWSIEFAKNQTKPGKYRIVVNVDKYFIFWINIADSKINVEVTDTLSGSMQFIQNGTARKEKFVSTTEPVNHTILLSESDFEYLSKKATYLQTYWFQNCTQINVTNGLNYVALYTEPERVYDIEAVVVASFEEPPAPTTTTTTTTTTTPKTTSTTTTTTPKPTSSSSTTSTTTKPPSNSTRSKRDINSPDAIMKIQATEGKAKGAALSETVAVKVLPQTNVTSHESFALINPQIQMKNQSMKYSPLFRSPPFFTAPPFNCVNKSITERDPMKIYGYFHGRIITKLPISNFTATGKNWLQHGDIVDLEIKCKGSPALQYCTLVFNAPYNATGNETCRIYHSLNECQFSYSRYFSESKTVLFFIRNDVSQTMNQVTINIYEAKKQSQLSVVVVPVSFTLVAIILVVFGVSYYIQSRNRFTVEVADFNFGETQSVDMEYKTFHQRLIDSIRDVLPSRRRFSQSTSEGAEANSPSNGGGVNSNLHYNIMGN